MKLRNFLNVMKPTRTYKVICDGAVAEFEPEAELIRSTKDKETGCVVFEIQSEEGEHENH